MLKTNKTQFTPADAKKHGVKLELLYKWQNTMNIIWSFLRSYEKRESAFKLIAIDNEIHCQLGNGKMFEIEVNIMNNTYLVLKVRMKDNADFEASYTHIDMITKGGIVRILADILTYGEYVKKQLSNK